jgi:glycerate kinase
MATERRPVLVAPDSFKGTLDAATVAAAIGRGLETAGLRGDLCPLADGGEGTGAVLRGQLGGEERVARVRDPLGRERDASFVLLGDRRSAVVEVAEASGLVTVAVAERDAEAASSGGTGELILAAIAAGATRVLVAAGGSATSDGGAGAIAAIEAGGGLGGAELTVLCDVRTTFELAAGRFGPQKGADPAAVGRLERRLEALARELPRDPRGVPMSGAAGGLAGGLWARYDARLAAGAAFVLDAIDFDRRLRASRALIVGEGRIDATTLEGKALAECATRARQIGVPAFAIVAINAIDRFDMRILDLQTIVEAQSVDQIERAAVQIASGLGGG